MAATKVNKLTIKKLSLKRLAKQRKKLGGGDAGFISDRILTRNN